MSTKNLWKILGVLLETWIFYLIANPILGAILSWSAMLSDIGHYALIVVCLVCMAGSIVKIFRKNQKEEKEKEKTEDIRNIRVRADRTPKKAFKKQIRLLDTQTERMEQKVSELDRRLKDYFGDSKISYEKFARTIDGVRKVFLDNNTRILDRIDLFDEKGYEALFERHQEYTDAIKPYQRTIDMVDRTLEENEQILQKMDRLLLEVSSLSDRNESVENLPAMQEMNELIDQTKLYRQQ